MNRGLYRHLPEDDGEVNEAASRQAGQALRL